MSETVSASIDVVHNGTTVHPMPNQMNIEQAVTDAWSTAEFKLDYGDAPSIYLNDDVTIWLSKGTIQDFNKEFTGKVRSIEQIAEGKEARWLEISCIDYSKYLWDRTWKGSTIAQASTIISLIVQPLIDEGKLADKTINIIDKVIQTKSDGEYYGDLIRKICSGGEEQIDADWYVDLGKTLHVFTVGSRPTTFNVAENALSYLYKEDLERLINKQKIWGAFDNTLGTDGDYTESTTNWTSNGNLSTDSNNKEEGSYSIKSKLDNGYLTEIWMERSFSPALNLNPSGEVVIHLQYRCTRDYYDKIKKSELETKFGNSEGYFTLYHKLPGGRMRKKDLVLEEFPPYLTGWYYYPFSELIFETGKASGTEYSIIGNPDWGSIDYIRFQVKTPETNQSGEDTNLWIDGMKILAPFYGEYEDSASQTSYDLKEGKPLVNTNLRNNEACSILSSLIVSAYKDPMVNVDNLVTTKNFEIDVGQEAVFKILDIDKTLTVRRIRYDIEDLNLHTEFDLSPRYIPEPEEMLSTFKYQLERFGWDLEAWKKGILNQAVLSFRTGLEDWWDIDPASAAPSFTESKNIITVGEGKLDQTNWGLYKTAGAEATLDLGYAKLEAPESTDLCHLWSRKYNIAYSLPIYLHFKFKGCPSHGYPLGIIRVEPDGLGVPVIGDSGFGVYYYSNQMFSWAKSTTGYNTIDLLVPSIDPTINYEVDVALYPGDRILWRVNKVYKSTLTDTDYLPDENMGYFASYTTGEKTIEIWGYQVATDW